MNLIELSSVIDVAATVLKDRIKAEFQTIILSEYAQVPPRIVDAILGGADRQTFFDRAQDPSNPSVTGYGEAVTGSLCPTKRIGLQAGGAYAQRNSSQPRHRVATREEVEATERLFRSCARDNILIIIDTCSILNPGFPEFYERFAQLAARTQLKLIVPFLVKEEIAHKYSTDAHLKNVCMERMRLLLSGYEAGIISFVGSKEDQRATRKDGGIGIQADPTLLEKALSYRTRGRSVLLITQDHNLSLDALSLNHFNSFEVKALVLAKKIIRGGALSDNAEDAVCPQLM